MPEAILGLDISYSNLSRSKNSGVMEILSATVIVFKLDTFSN